MAESEPENPFYTGGIAPRSLPQAQSLTPAERFDQRQDEPEEENIFLHNPVTRGVAGAVEGILEIPRIFGADYDIPDNFGLGHSTSTVGSLVEGSIQFMSGFIPGTFGLGHFGKAGKATKIAKSLTKARKARAAKAVAAGDRTTEASQFAKVKAADILERAGMSAKEASKAARRYGFKRSMAVGALADASVFTADEERLSNLLQHFGADNFIVNNLAANPDDDQALGRFKNMIEGAGIGAAVEAVALGVRTVFRRKQILEDPTLTDAQRQDELARDIDEASEAASDAVGRDATEAPDSARATDDTAPPDTPATPDVDGDLAQMSFRELQQEAKNYSGVKRGGKGVTMDSLRRDITEARNAAEKQRQVSQNFDNQQYPNRGATETAEEAAARTARGEPVPQRDSRVPHKSDETQLEMGAHAKEVEDQFGPDWNQVEKRVDRWTETDPTTGQKKKRQKTVYAYKNDPNRPVEPGLIAAMKKREKLMTRMLQERRAEIIIGDRPKSDIASALPGGQFVELAHHAGLRSLGESVVRNREIPKQKMLEIIGALDEQLKLGDFTPEKIPGVMNTAMLGPESFGVLVKIAKEHGVVKPANMVDANGKNLGYRTVSYKVRDPATGNMLTKQKVVNRAGNTVREEEIAKIRMRVLANQTGSSMKKIQAKLERHATDVDNITHDAQAMSSMIAVHIKHARQLYGAMQPQNIDLRKQLGLKDEDAAVRAFSRWMEDAAPMIESHGRYRRNVSRGLYMMRYGADQIIEPGMLRKMLDDAGGATRVREMGDKLFGRDGAFDSGGVAGANVALRQIDRNKRIWWMVNEHFVNFVLSGIRTFSTNTIGNTMTAVYGPMEALISARVKSGLLSMTGQKSTELQAEVLRSTQEFFGIWGQISDAASLAKKAWKKEDYILDPGKGTLDMREGQQSAWTSENWAALRGQEHDPTKFSGQRFMDIWGPVLRTPSRALMATDEFFKQLNYRSSVRADLIVEANKLRSAGLLRDNRAPTSGFVGPQQQSMDDWVAEEMTEMTARGQALIKDNLVREADKRFTIDMKDESGNQKYMHAEGHIALAASKRNWIEQQLKGGLVNRGAIADRAVEVARERTFTTELDPERGFLSDAGKTLSQFSTRHPSMRLFVPFIRTPLNIFVYASRRTAIPILNKDILGAAEYLRSYKLQGKGLDSMKSQMARELASPDARVRNAAHGRMMASAGWLFGITAAAQTGVITGAGPADKDMRNVMMNSGWQPYSIKVGDTYVSYQKLDPVATVLGLYADMGDAAKWATEDDQPLLERLTVSAAISIAHNMQSKSYLQGLTNMAGMINDPEFSIPSVGGRMLGALAVPSFVAGFRELSDESYSEMRGVLDGLYSRIPGLSPVMLDPMRNAIGEKVDRRNFEGAAKTVNDINALMNPLTTNRTTSDVITKEFAMLEYPFSTPSRLKYGMDLTDAQNDKGQSAYDRWLELSSTIKVGGRTMRQRLERLINSNSYQSMPMEGVGRVDVDSPRIKELMKIIRAYRSYAIRDMLQEFPEVGEAARAQTVARSALARDVDPALISAQLFPVE